MRGLLIVLTVLLLSVTIYLVRYYLAVKSLSKQIEEKLVEESHRRITLKNQPKSLVTLTNQIESLFTQIEKTNLVALQEKKTMDMAISNIAHDIRTPLTVASGYAQQSLRSSSEDEMAMEKISKNLLTVSKRLEALLEYRRLTKPRGCYPTTISRGWTFLNLWLKRSCLTMTCFRRQGLHWIFR